MFHCPTPRMFSRLSETKSLSCTPVIGEWFPLVSIYVPAAELCSISRVVIVYRAGRLVPFHRRGTSKPVILENTLREQYSAAGLPSIYPYDVINRLHLELI